MSKQKICAIISAAVFCAAVCFAAASPAIKAGDTVSVVVKGEPDLSVERLVSEDGSIMLPLIGDVGVSGLKPSDAARLISNMLEDGFLRNPVVQVLVQSKSKSNAAVEREEALLYGQEQPLYYGQTAGGAENDNLHKSNETRLIEIVDSETMLGIGGAVLNIDNRIYQSNRLGQVVLDAPLRHAVVLADGYQTFSGSLNSEFAEGDSVRVVLNPITFAKSITFTVVDAATRRAIANVEVTLDGGKIKTNKNGEFRISQIKKEFGELILRHRGYQEARVTVDYKSPEPQTLFMLRGK